ncbi:MAG: DNA gyrase subunit A [Phocaeicola sp.]|uniref:DNA gyrase subunit A n=1 Tax=Phocaeicola TaxID=909656 RepID=UPI00234FB5D4|nr:DNA gyrase subunit A [Phocaeicola oris]MCE2615524.1 DNA gyrase subunit A [Phocaeicola oris]
MQDQDRIIKVNIDEEMKSSYIDYSMSVIVARALPDVRDGFKPVHRRILYGMMELGNTSDKPYKKCARIVGEVLGKYHPHGDSSVYGALVRQAQDWAMRYPLVDGQGNFGSIDGDSAAAMRYTEARLKPIGEEMMQDLYKETVDMVNNFDDTLKEPTVMPTRIPNLLVNGASGIAVGMATNMPTHNLSEVIDGCIAYIDDPDIDVAGLMKYIKGPDFPTGGFINGIGGVRDAYETGKGRVVMRAKTEIESEENHDKIIVEEIPYNVNKKELIENIASLVNDKKIEGISNVNDESDREGMRIVIDIKRDANANVVLNKLFKLTAMQSAFSVNNIALVNGRPKCLNLKDLIKYFIRHRHDVVIRRTKFDLKKAQERAHILEGLIIACDNIDEVVHIIRASKTPQEATENLCKRFNLDDVQAKAIVEMRLRQLTGLSQEQLHAEYEELEKQIAYLQSILDDPELCKKVIKDELIEVKEKYGDERRTQIRYDADDSFNPEDFYADDDVVITISHLGYIKRTLLSDFRTQNRGGVGSKGSETRDTDFVEHIYPATMHNTMMFFTKKGRCFWLKVYEIPEGNKTSKGRAIQNVLNIEPGDAVTAYIRIKDLSNTQYINEHCLMFCTKRGLLKKTLLEQYSRPRTNGINAINILEGDEVIDVCLTRREDEIIIANRNGRAVRFNEHTVRMMGRTATGVKGMTLDDGDDYVIGMVRIKDPKNETIMVVSEQGYGKRSEIEDYRLTNRGGKGVKTLNITDKTGKLIAIKSVTNDHDLMIINKSGITIRLKLADVRIMGRATQGVRLINLEKRNDEIASVCKVNSEANEDKMEDDVDDENLTTTEPSVNEDNPQIEEESSDMNENNNDN